MTFDGGADAYQRFMGIYADVLAGRFVELLAPRRGSTALDVGAGSGALTEVLVRSLGADAVAAVDPSAPMLQGLRSRLPGVRTEVAGAQELPFEDGAFDLTAAQLVVHFLDDPVAGVVEMGRVTRPGGVVAANTWDFGGGRAPLSLFWQAARELDPSVRDESDEPGVREGELEGYFVDAGLGEVRASSITIAVPYADFDAWWLPYTLGVGPAGAHVASLDPDARAALRARCEHLLPPGPGAIEATAWVALGEA